MKPSLEQRRKAAKLAIHDIWGSQAEFSRASGISTARVSRALDPDQVTERRLSPVVVKISDLSPVLVKGLGALPSYNSERDAFRNAGVIVRNAETGKVWFTIKFPEHFAVVNPIEVGVVSGLADIGDTEGYSKKPMPVEPAY